MTQFSPVELNKALDLLLQTKSFLSSEAEAISRTDLDIFEGIDKVNGPYSIDNLNSNSCQSTHLKFEKAGAAKPNPNINPALMSLTQALAILETYEGSILSNSIDSLKKSINKLTIILKQTL